MLAFSLRGVRITVKFGFCMVILFMFCAAGEKIIPCLFCSALHECGHLLICARYRLRIRSLYFGTLGLKLRLLKDDALLTPGQSFWLHSGGILMTLFSGILFVVLGLREWMAVSFFLSAFHLIPMRDMDGGRIFAAIGTRFTDAKNRELWVLLGQGIGCMIFAFLAAAALWYRQNVLALMFGVFAVCGVLPAREA